MKMLATKATPILQDGKITGHIYHHSLDTSNARANMAISYDHYFSDIKCDAIDTTDDKDNLVTYQTLLVSQRILKEIIWALIHGGANGGIGGRDMLIIAWHPGNRKVNIGIAGDHQMTGVQLATFAAYIMSNDGPFIGIFNNYAHCPEQAQSIHSKIQLQAHGNLVYNTSRQFGGLQMIRNNAGHHTPLRYVSGLPYLEQQPPTKDEMTNNRIPHVIMTREGIWNP